MVGVEGVEPFGNRPA